MSALEARVRLCQRFAWAIPNDEALEAMAKHSPIVEVGAGSGYWAWLLRQRGVDVVAYDIEPPVGRGHQNRYHETCAEPWTEVLEGDADKLTEHGDRALFLCWPPYNTAMASSCLERYSGSTLLYVGEGWGGCTGDNAFHTTLQEGWKNTETIWLPQYSGIHDRLEIWVRK